MIFNTTLLYALTISSFHDHSPLIALNQLAKDSSFKMKEVKLSNFFNNALKVNQLLQSIYVDRSKFSYFLNNVIIIQSEDCEISQPGKYNNVKMTVNQCAIFTNSSFNNIESSFDYGAIECTIQNPDHYFIVDRCNFTACKAKYKGGAIYFVGSRDSSRYNAITYCNFVECYVDGRIDAQMPQTRQNNEYYGYGGSVYCETSKINFRNSVFNSSKVFVGGYGGAIYANVTDINDTTYFTSFYNCSVDGEDSYGGAMFIELADKSFYNMSYMTFDECNAKNGQCVYAVNISKLNINYTRIYNIRNNVFMADDDNFTFSIRAIRLNDTINVQLINASNYTNQAKSISIDLYGRGPFDNIDGISLVNRNIVNYCLVFIHGIDEYQCPVVAPENASLSLEEVETLPAPPNEDNSENEITSESTLESTSENEQVPTPDPPTRYFSESQPFTNSDAFAPAAGSSGGGGGLSTVAIIFIVLACLIVVIAIIIFVIFYLRSHGRCQCGGNDSLAGMKSSTYF